jgi:hypothetical protein
MTRTATLLDTLVDEPHQRLEVGELGDATGGDDRAVGGGADVAEQLQVGPLEHAVLVHVGHDVPRTTLVVEAGEDLVEITALPGPAPSRQRASSDVEADRDPVSVLGDRLGTPLRVLEGSGADVDPSAARRERSFERLVIADAAAHLHVDVERADDLREQLPVVPAAECGVEVDEMEPLGPPVLPVHRGFDRVAEPLLRPGDTLHELDSLATRDVDGGQQLQVCAHGDKPRQRPRGARPRPTLRRTTSDVTYLQSAPHRAVVRSRLHSGHPPRPPDPAEATVAQG